MNLLLTELCASLHNYFKVKDYTGLFTILDGELQVDFIKEGQYYRIKNSIFNDGVWLYSTEDDDDDDTAEPSLTDEIFFGTITTMAVPPAFLALAREIEAWQLKNGSDDVGIYQSESFGGYSYQRATNADGSAVTWKDAFKKRLNAWRKI